MYTITFQDNTTFHGGDLQNSKWSNIPDKPIARWNYKIFNKSVALSGYQCYNHLIERVNIGGQNYITQIILMGHHITYVDCITFDLKTKQLYKTKAKYGQEYCGRATTGWKSGIDLVIPNIEISNT